MVLMSVYLPWVFPLTSHSDKMKLPLAGVAGRGPRQSPIEEGFSLIYHGTHAAFHIIRGGPETYAQKFLKHSEMKEHMLIDTSSHP